MVLPGFVRAVGDRPFPNRRVGVGAAAAVHAVSGIDGRRIPRVSADVRMADEVAGARGIIATITVHGASETLVIRCGRAAPKACRKQT